MGKAKIISSKELGPHCWLPARFCEDARCPRVLFCSYPERDTCKAVEAEKEYLRLHFRTEAKRLASQYRQSMKALEPLKGGGNCPTSG